MDPAQWIDVGEYAIAQVQTLGVVAQPELIQPSEVDLRARLSAVLGAEDPERAKFLAELQTKPSGARTLQAPSWVIRALARIGQALQSRRGGNENARGTKQSVAQRTATPSAFSRWLDRMSWALANLAFKSKLGQLLGRKQAEYLSELMEAFDRGDLMSALSKAIPLSGDPAAEPARASFSTPTARANLSLTLTRAQSGTSLVLGGFVFDDLRSRYRHAAKRLEAQGKFKEAAFVYADLLDEPLRGCEMLELAKEPRLAAELAEARALSPGIVVRYWFLAGEQERAVAVAIRTRSFADAALRLEKAGDIKQAVALRVLWGDHLAAAGDFGAAVEALWPMQAARRLAERFLELAIAQGGAMGARMMVRKLVLASGDTGEVTERALDILEDDAADERPSREALIESLVREKPVSAPKMLIRAAIRSACREIGGRGDGVSPAVMKELLKLDVDGLLAADLPALPRQVPVASRVYSFEAPDRGAVSAMDAALLSDGRVLVALGAMGVRLHGRNGAALQHFEIPTGEIVLSDLGSRALFCFGADPTRVRSFDCVRTKPGLKLELAVTTATTSSFDGAVWFVAEGSTVFAIDTTAEKPRMLWRVTDVGQRVVRLSRTAHALVILTQVEPDAEMPLEEWLYELPSMTLRSKKDFDSSLFAGLAAQVESSAAGKRVAVSFIEPNQFNVRMSAFAGGHWSTSFFADGVLGARLEHEWLVLDIERQDAREIQVLRTADLTVQTTVRLMGVGRVTTKLRSDSLTVCDDAGRVLVIALPGGELIRNLRLS